MKGQVPEEIKTRRSNRLFQDTAGMSEAFLHWYDGRSVEVLMEEPVWIDGKRYFTGYTPEYVKAALPAEEELSNQMISGVVCGELPGHVMMLRR